MLRGADVSKYQGTIDWNAFAPQTDFVFIRATHGKSSVDPQLERNRREAARAGIIRGYYHFADPAQDPIAQAEHFHRTVGGLSTGELDLVLDLEWTQHHAQPAHVWTAQDTTELVGWTRAFVGEIKARYPGRSLILYTGPWFWKHHMGGSDELQDLPLWIAAYTRGQDSQAARPPQDTSLWAPWALERPVKSCSPWSRWTFWQFSPRAVMAGVTVNSVDANLFDGTLQDLRVLARLEAAPSPPTRPALPTADALCTVVTPSRDRRGLAALPPRPKDALTGTQFLEKTKDLGLGAREALVSEQIMSGNFPDFLRKFVDVAVHAPYLDCEGVVRVAPDYLAVGSDDDFLRIALTPITAQRIADACGCVLPTPRIVDVIYASSQKQVAIPFPPDGAMTKISTFKEHDQQIAAKLVGKVGELLAGHKKDVVVTKRLKSQPRRLAIYGFHRADGKVWQPLNIKMPHEDTYVDYSHGIRLVSGIMLIHGEEHAIGDVLLDPGWCELVSSEGINPFQRYEVRKL